eukprot:GFUD01043278.1.p1 GENE.GFUD01043278.1~~GFUD01043278.1.p1  ORF type:complete len:532 (-),score=189.60 GFUD01043278.1:238-1833(-)
MSSVTVLCPNAHRVKVSTSPNMSLQAVLETACTKKGFDSAVHVLEHHNKRIDLSSTVRFSGIPNNASLEMVKLTEEQMALMNTKQEVSVCLQTPSGERLVETFPSTASLGLVVGRWSDKLGEPGIGEKPVVVYMRREVVGQEELNTTSLKTLGLTQGKGLFRFFYKKPEVLKSQANVYDMKIDKPSPPPEVRHIPMRLEPEPHKVAEDDTASVQREDNATTISHPDDPSLAKTGQEPNQPDQPVASTSQGREPSAPVSCVETGAAPPLPDSTQPTPDPVINHVGPHGAIVFSALEESAQYQDLDDEFFDLSLDEVKILYKDLRQEVKKMGEGELLLTKEMREAQKEGEKLSLLSRYKTGVLRIQFPDRHVVQGQFPPNATIADVIAWLSPLLSSPSTPCELYTAPPRTTLPETSTLLDLCLFPAALVHFSSRVTKAGPVQHLSDEALASLSNSCGANTVASQARRQGARGGAGGGQVGLQGELPVKRDLQTIPESRPGKRSMETTGGGSGQSSGVGGGMPGKVPKWFKTGK